MSPSAKARLSKAKLLVAALMVVAAFEFSVRAISYHGARHVRTSSPIKSPAPEHSPDRTILMTGFEVFGGFADNASWEAVSMAAPSLPKGWRTVKRQLRVIWGAPLAQLDEAIRTESAEYVFSFGQGNPGAFAIESRARNSRCTKADNDGAFASDVRIVPNGPDEYSLEKGLAANLAGKLKAEGWPVAVSTDAGQYLCEECLYSLLHLRATKYPALKPLFVHVPPLGSSLGGSVVTKEYLRKFVERLIVIRLQTDGIGY
ncbi:MAG: hypothetical protein WC712_06110 [Candidatus Brocadiia bacterium]